MSCMSFVFGIILLARPGSPRTGGGGGMGVVVRGRENEWAGPPSIIPIPKEETDIRSTVVGTGGGCGQRCIGRGGAPPPPLEGAQPMPSHCPPDAKCQPQWHL